MKILYVTTVGITMGFFKDFIRSLLDDGHTVEIATNEAEYKVAECYREWGCTVHPISTSRSPANKGNLEAVRQIKTLVEENGYDLVHCHTPIAAMCTRLACRKARKNGTRVIYTAHGFHFYKGAPLKNWLVYYPVEKLCAGFTDVLITINREDYALACAKLSARQIEYVSGVGIDLDKFGGSSADREAKRAELGVPEDARLLLSVGELNENKNHETAIRAIAAMEDERIHYVIAGRGQREAHLQGVIDELGLTQRVQLLGFRKDIRELCAAADAFVFPSFREGLSVSVMEAMASSLPCAVSRIRGNVDLIDENGGTLFDPHSVDECRAALAGLLGADFVAMGAYNAGKVERFSLERVVVQMKSIYTGCGHVG